MQTMKAEALPLELNCLQDESSESGDHSPSGMSLSFAGLVSTFDLKMVPKLLSALSLEEDEASCSEVDEDGCLDGEVDLAEEAVLIEPFHSKFVNIFPLYQDYCAQADQDEPQADQDEPQADQDEPQADQDEPQADQDEPQAVSMLHMSELFPSRCLQPRFSPQWCRETLALVLRSSLTTSAPPNHPMHRPNLYSCWRDLDEVTKSGLLRTMTTREIRLQESMFELISSEASYLRSLGVAINHFYASRALRQTLSLVEHHSLFSNIRDVMVVSEKFLMDLEARLDQSVMIPQVGDIVLQHCPTFNRLYVPYVTNMMYQEALVQQLLQQNRAFSSVMKKLESHPVCQRQSLKSFLVLPFQRITRMKLILENVLKLTEPGSDAIVNLERAIEAIHEIAVSCDARVRRMKQIEELICLDALIDFGRLKAVPLVVRGRFLVRQGPVRQLCGEPSSRGSLADVHLHLFNDLLLISTKRDQRFMVVDHAAFPAHVHLEQLKPETLGLPAHSFLLHLSQSQNGHPTAMILVALTRSDKEMWTTALSNIVKET